MLARATAEIKVTNQRFPREISGAKCMRTLCEAKELTLQVSEQYAKCHRSIPKPEFEVTY